MPLPPVEAGVVGRRLPLNRFSTGDTIARRLLSRARYADRAESRGSTDYKTWRGRIRYNENDKDSGCLIVGRLAADEGHSDLQPLVEGHKVGGEAGGDAPQALAEAERGGGVA